MTPRDAQRQARRAAGCQDTVTPPVPFKLPPPNTPPVNHCDPPDPAVPDKFTPPTALPPAPKRADFRMPIVPVGNDLQTQSCSDLAAANPALSIGPMGEVVVITSNRITVPVDLQTIPGLNESQSLFISGFSADDLAQLPTADAATLETTCKLLGSQAQALADIFAAAKQSANAQALTLAQSLLICQWVNAVQTARCPEGAVATGAVVPPGVASPQNPVAVAAGLFSSQISQADADAQALTAAQSALSCLWLNADTSLRCPDLGFAEPVPIDVVPVAPNLPLRIGTVTVAAGTVAGDSQAAADASALSMASSALSCFYLNPDVTLTCENIGIMNTAEVGAGQDGPGNPVTVSANTIVSQISTDDAVAQAKTVAQGYLSCFWLNEDVTAICPEQTLNAGLPNAITYQP